MCLQSVPEERVTSDKLRISIYYEQIKSSGRPGFNPWPGHTKDSKMVLDAALLNTQHYKVRIKGKVINPGNGVAPSHTAWCGRY